MKKLLYIFVFILSSVPLFGQATTGYHRVSQVIARSNSGTYAVVVPFATVIVTDTATGDAATIYNDPLLTSPISPPIVTADLSGNYGYYMALNTCVTETISSPGMSSITIPNICGNPASLVTLQTNGVNNGSQTLLNLVAGTGIVLENAGGNVTINAESGSGVTSINTVSGAFTFAGSGVSCASTTCTFPASVFSVGLALPANTFSITNSPVTSSGNLTGSFINQNSSYVLRGPLAGGSPASPTWGQLSQDDILPGFTINSFNCAACVTVEIGATVTNPSFTATYSSTPASAAITNTDGISSPTNLSTPFTSGTVTGSFVHTTATSTTFTLTAVLTSTKIATQTITSAPRTFGGVGTAGATGATASGTNAVLAGATGTLSSAGFNNQANYGPYSPSGQKIYILMIGGSHTFKDAVTGFAVPMLTPTAVSFTNQYGSVVSMFFYETVNTVTGPFTLQVNS